MLNQSIRGMIWYVEQSIRFLVILTKFLTQECFRIPVKQLLIFSRFLPHIGNTFIDKVKFDNRI